MIVGLGQINPTIGDLAGNVERCLKAVDVGLSQGADLIVFPAMALPGGPARDILNDSSFIESLGEAARDLSQRISPNISVLIGSVLRSTQHPPHHPALMEAALFIQRGRVRPAAYRRLLRTGGVYNEARWFVPGPFRQPIEVGGKKVGVLFDSDLDEDGAAEHPAAELRSAGASLLVCLANTPFIRGGWKAQLQLAQKAGGPLFWVNLCGATDELIYAGASFGLAADGQVCVQAPGFEESLLVIDPKIKERPALAAPDPEEELFKALTCGVRDFTHKNGIERAFIGVSGGVDSAVTAAIACAALGPGAVSGVMIPSRFTDPRSVAAARALCQTLGCRFETVALEPLHRAAEEALGDLLKSGTGAENIQARLRAMILMAFVNRHRGILLNTTNKTELSVGYITLYGDMAGTLSPLGDLTKPEIFRLARWINRVKAIIPDFILDRAPTAELSPGQVDPFDYEKVSPELEALVQADRSNLALRHSEYKRWQMGVILKVSPRSFGTGRLIPITRK